MNRFVILNSEVVEKKEINLTFLYLDEPVVISKKIWFGYGGIPLFTENLNLIIEQIKILKLPCPEFFKNKRELFRITKRMLNKNKYYRSGHIQIQLFWANSQFQYLILCNPFNTFEFPYQEKGILVTYSELKKYSRNDFNRYAFYCENLWTTSITQIRDSIFQNVLILNENQSICEVASANIYCIKGESIVTPSLKTGSYEDILRSTILNIAVDLGFSVKELTDISKQDLLEMDEIFTVGEESGVQWILGVENRRFIRNFSSKFHGALNRYLKGKVS